MVKKSKGAWAERDGRFDRIVSRFSKPPASHQSAEATGHTGVERIVGRHQRGGAGNGGDGEDPKFADANLIQEVGVCLGHQDWDGGHKKLVCLSLGGIGTLVPTWWLVRQGGLCGVRLAGLGRE